MLMEAIKIMIQKGMTEGLQEKMDIFLTVGSLTTAQYLQLVDLLPATIEDADTDEQTVEESET